MQEITINDCFGQAIAKYSDGLEIGVEIGGGTGDGSTQCIKTKSLSSFEIHPDRIGRHRMNLELRKGGNAWNYPSSNPQKWMTKEEIANFYNTKKTKLNQYSIEQILNWLEEDIKIASSYHWGFLTFAPKIDFLLLDGGAFSGKADLEEWLPRVNEGGIIALDDTNDIKNKDNYDWLKNSNYNCLWEEPSWRNGCAIFKK